MCPLVVLALSSAISGLPSALLVIGALSVLLAAVTAAVRSTDAKPVLADGVTWSGPNWWNARRRKTVTAWSGAGAGRAAAA